MFIYAEILLISRNHDNWLSRLSNDTLKIIAKYFLKPDYDEFAANIDEWREILGDLKDYDKKYRGYEESLIMQKYKYAGFDELWQRALRDDGWIRVDNNYCWMARKSDCDCNHESDNDTMDNMPYYRLLGTNFQVCEYSYPKWIRKHIGDDYINIIKDGLKAYLKEIEWSETLESSQDREESNDSS